MSELHKAPERDHFSKESPVRAFTDWQVEGGYALGKGFRPSLQHLVPYLNAMEEKEGWRVVQVLEAATSSPSFLFRKFGSRAISDVVNLTLTADTTELRDTFRKAYLEVAAHWGDGKTRDYVEYNDAGEVTSEVLIYDESGTVVGATTPLKDDPGKASDPINPKHYNGRACADIGERLSANGYQILKYTWRLGKKDDPCQELGKALWYLDSEVALISRRSNRWVLPDLSDIKEQFVAQWFNERLAEVSPFTEFVARSLWKGYNAHGLKLLRVRIAEEKTHLECGHGLAI